MNKPMYERVYRDIHYTVFLVSLDRFYWSSEHQAWRPIVQYKDEYHAKYMTKTIDRWYEQFRALGIPTAKAKYL